MPTVEHPRIRPGTLEEREYQASVAATAVDANTLVVLPTGLGKTAIALRVVAEYLRRAPTQSVLFLAPTRPLVVQHAASVARTVFSPPPIALTGAIPPERRADLLHPPQVVVATPQVVGNDLRDGAFPLGTFSLIVFDEAHRAVGDYPYVAIGRANQAGPRARVLAMTASPGGSEARIREVWTNLGIDRFEYRTERSPDVSPYLHGIGVETVSVPLPAELQEIRILLRAVVQRQVDALRKLDLLPEGVETGRRALLELGQRLHRQIEVERRQGGGGGARLWAAVTAQAAAMKALHALELGESQGVEALREYLRRQAPPEGRRISPATRTFLTDPDLVEVRRRLDSNPLEHPKIARAVGIVVEELHRNPGARVIVFSQYRDTVDKLIEELERLGDPAVRPARFVGQAARDGDPGLSQKEQVGQLDRFRDGAVNCLVATSVAEEGLDIPATDLVVFYEPIPDVIRTIQRRGRTGRARTGRAVVLVAEGTRDVGMNRGAVGRERRMHEMLERVQSALSHGDSLKPPERPKVQRILSEFN
ncbi:MAG TPA: helicase-related protein [Thermoplasmata archaeon]|nr:helicase-related protein [Thermoplasmata archaeon]